MSNIVSDKAYIQNEATQFRSAVSESLAVTVGGAINYLNDKTDQLQTDLNTEVSDRIAGDAAEASARMAADSSEASARAAADSSEATTRANADTNLQNQINTNVTSINNLNSRVTTLELVTGAVAASTGAFVTTSSTYVSVTNQSLSITTHGKPVFVCFTSDGANEGSILSSTNAAYVEFLRDSTPIAFFAIHNSATTLSPGSLSFIDFVGAGSHTYEVQARLDTSGTLAIDFMSLQVYEMI